MVESGAERTTTTKSLLESSYNGVIFYGAICSEFIIHHNLCGEQQGERLWKLGFFGEVIIRHLRCTHLNL